LILSARQAGWLTACVKYKDDREKKTRAREIIEAGGQPPFLHCSNGRHLIEALQDLGNYSVTEAGIDALTWLEIKSYADATGLVSEAWELQTVRAMSEAFVQGLREGEDPLSIPPTERSL